MFEQLILSPRLVNLLCWRITPKPRFHARRRRKLWRNMHMTHSKVIMKTVACGLGSHKLSNCPKLPLVFASGSVNTRTLIYHATVHGTWCFHGNQILTGLLFKISSFAFLDRFMMFLFVLLTYGGSTGFFKTVGLTDIGVTTATQRWRHHFTYHLFSRI